MDTSTRTRNPDFTPEFDEWLFKVERYMGHDVDGELHTHGYSIATFHNMYDAGLSPQVASTRIIGAVFIDAAGGVHRLTEAKTPIGGTYTERYKTQHPTGASSTTYTLPDSAVLSWAPDRGASVVGICAGCGEFVGADTILTDEWRASAHCMPCLHGEA